MLYLANILIDSYYSQLQVLVERDGHVLPLLAHGCNIDLGRMRQLVTRSWLVGEGSHRSLAEVLQKVRFL